MHMDLWVVAVAAGAGYLAKYWKNVLGDKEGSSGHSLPDNSESSSLIQWTNDKTRPSHKFYRKGTTDQLLKEAGNGDHSDEISVGTSRKDGLFAMDVVCASASLLLHESENEKCEGYRDGYGLDADIPAVPEYQTWEMTALHSSRSRKCLRSRRLQHHPLPYMKPHTSVDTRVMAQMHRERSDMEDYLRTPMSSPCTPSLRPFLVTDGRRVISRASGEFRNDLDKEEILTKADNGVLGVPHLPQITTIGYSKQKLSKSKNRMGKSSNINTSLLSDKREGLSSGQVLLCLGISIGVMSTLIANEFEVEKLKDSLKKSENLVEDLQEELEMKDSSTVKELSNDGDSQDILESLCGHEKLNLFSSQADMTFPISYADEESVSPEKVESLSKIEAELEAELERLELSMKGSLLQERSSDTIELYQELDEDVNAELVHGELNAAIFGGKSSSEPTPDRGSTPLSAKEGVSPRELSLRLHEVIQSRLQERIVELEAELAKRQKRIHQLESEKNSWREVYQSELSSTLGSPMAPPLVMNLSEDALDAYSEAFDELNKLTGSRNQDDSWIQGDDQKHNVISINQEIGDNLIGIDNGGNRDEGSPNDFYSRDDSGDDLLLIKQIVEKARQGSPAILRAQRSLVWMSIDEN